MIILFKVLKSKERLGTTILLEKELKIPYCSSKNCIDHKSYFLHYSVYSFCLVLKSAIFIFKKCFQCIKYSVIELTESLQRQEVVSCLQDLSVDTAASEAV